MRCALLDSQKPDPPPGGKNTGLLSRVNTACRARHIAGRVALIQNMHNLHLGRRAPPTCRMADPVSEVRLARLSRWRQSVSLKGYQIGDKSPKPKAHSLD